MIIIEPSKNVSNSYDIFTTQIYGANIIPSIIYLDHFNGNDKKFHEKENLFPDKLIDLNKHRFRLSIFNYKPYTLWHNVVRNKT